MLRRRGPASASAIWADVPRDDILAISMKRCSSPKTNAAMTLKQDRRWRVTRALISVGDRALRASCAPRRPLLPRGGIAANRAHGSRNCNLGNLAEKARRGCCRRVFVATHRDCAPYCEARPKYSEPRNWRQITSAYFHFTRPTAARTTQDGNGDLARHGRYWFRTRESMVVMVQGELRLLLGGTWSRIAKDGGPSEKLADPSH